MGIGRRVRRVAWGVRDRMSLRRLRVVLGIRLILVVEAVVGEGMGGTVERE